VAAISIAAGLLIGILLSKLNQMVMLRLVEKTASLRFGVSAHAVVLTAVVFVGIFLLLLAGSLRQVHVSSPIELLRGGDVGEREPKANYALALLG
jgi:putative ABC transport system permease protein